MFIGHFGVALAAKRMAPRTSLATLVAASTFIDLLWPILLLLGAERVRLVEGGAPFMRLDFESYPISHSALLVVAWGLIFGALYQWRTGYRAGAVAAAALVVSHWVLDLATHLPDLPLWPGGPKVGLGLWRSPATAITVEAAIFLAGTAIYLAATRARSAAGTWGFAGFLVLLLVTYGASVVSPAPPSVTVLGVSAIVGSALTLAWAAWSDHGREPRPR